MNQEVPKTGSVTPIEEKHGSMPHLLTGDIVFVRHKKSFFRKYLRKVTDSYWDHTTMVLFPRDVEKKRYFSVIVESIHKGVSGTVRARGVTLHKLDKYLHDPDKYDIGIKRVPDLSDQERKYVQLFMLMNVDAPYWPWKPFAIWWASFSKKRTEKILKKQRFSCSSLIQKAYYDAMLWSKKPHVIFKDGVWSPIELQELTSPGDIARSKNTVWIYNER